MALHAFSKNTINTNFLNVSNTNTEKRMKWKLINITIIYHYCQNVIIIIISTIFFTNKEKSRQSKFYSKEQLQINQCTLVMANSLHIVNAGDLITQLYAYFGYPIYCSVNKETSVIN